MFSACFSRKRKIFGHFTSKTQYKTPQKHAPKKDKLTAKMRFLIKFQHF